jgi:hypothetical protein
MKLRIKINKDLLKDVLVYSLTVFVILVGLYFGINTFNYLDPAAACYIDVDGHVLNGNKRTIMDALKMIKKNDRQQYKTVCRYVKKISENYCIGSDWHLDLKWKEKSIGKDCYIRGSKTIYLYPREQQNIEIISQRSESIKVLSNLSKRFWESK